MRGVIVLVWGANWRKNGRFWALQGAFFGFLEIGGFFSVLLGDFGDN